MRQPAFGTHGAVTGGTDYATQSGMRLLQAGGNAVDAGVAATLAASITEYSHFGFGGEGPILIRTKDGKVFSIAGIGTMPKSATADLFRKREIKVGEILTEEKPGLPGVIPVAGLMPAVVPGMVEAVLVSLREFGTKPFHEVIVPAIELADGTPLDETRGNGIQRLGVWWRLWPTSYNVFSPGGKVYRIGEVFKQPDLARTLRSMADVEKKALAAGATRVQAIDAVRDFFYRGEIARKIDAFVKANGGLLTYEDMAAFRLQPEPAETVTYKGYQVYKPGFWSQGPVLLETLNILEGMDLKSMRMNSGEYVHTLLEAMKLAYADRDTYYGDPKFVNIPSAQLLSKEYAAARRALIGMKASMEFRPGVAGDEQRLHPSQSAQVKVRIDEELMARDTTCVNAMDKDGMMFSITPSGAWFPAVIAGDTGIPLTQRAQSFLLVPGHPNELAGGKRPRVTLSPTIVTRSGQPYLALSTPGGDNQDQALLQILLNIVEFGMNSQDATEAPRIQSDHLVSSFDNHAMSPGETEIDDRVAASVIADLKQRGHLVKVRSKWFSGAAPTVIRMLPNGVIEAAADPYAYRSALAW